MPLPSALQLSVLPLSLLLESSLRLIFTTAPTVCLCFGSVYFNLLGSNNISRPGVRKARKKVNGKIAGCCYRKTTDRFRKKIRWFFFFLFFASYLDIVCSSVCMQTQVEKESCCFAHSTEVCCTHADTISPHHMLTQICMHAHSSSG